MKNFLILSMLVTAFVPGAHAQKELESAKSASPLSEGAAKNARGISAVKLIPLKRVPFNAGPVLGAATIAFDDDTVYLSTPDGFIHATDSLASDFHTILDTKGQTGAKVYVHNHVLYVLSKLNEGESPDHTMFASKDKGRNFYPIDTGLQVCHGGTCYYIGGDRLFAEGDRLYTNGGGGNNLQVSANHGATWTAVSGLLDGQLCYKSPFEIAGRTVLQGGECPLDRAFLSRGLLAPDRMSLVSELQPTTTPDLSNRKINTIVHKPGTSIVLAGAEGAILRSEDDGRTWEYVMQKTTGYYPYVPSILFPANAPGLVLAAGFDKGGEETKPFLAYGLKDGTEWHDLSHLLADIDAGQVSDLKQDPYGRLLAVVTNDDTGVLTIYEVRFSR